MPALPAVNGTVNNLLHLMTAIDFTAITNVITSLNTTINNFPSESGVVQQIQLLSEVTDAVPCLSVVSDQIVAFNTTLFKMPAVCGVTDCCGQGCVALM